MATHHAIAAIGQAILNLLADARPPNEFTGAQFKLYQATDFQKGMDEGISLYLYRLTPNTCRRNLPPRLGPDGGRFRPSLPLDLYYLLTAWAATADTQHRLLGWAMRTLEDTPILPSGVLNLQGPEIRTFRDEESIELVQEPLSIQDMATIWEMMKPKVQISITYVARMVLIDSKMRLSEAQPTQTREF